MDKDINDRTGTIRKMNNGELFKCIAYRNNKDCDFELVNKEHNYIVYHKLYRNFEHGSMKSPYSKSVANVGYLGGNFTNVTHMPSYKMWSNMISRCYNTRTDRRRDINYLGCSVDEEWHSFYNFNEWFEEEIKKYKSNEKMCLDKDLLVKNNKVYSKKTCVLIPDRVNIFFTKTTFKRGNYPIGVYKKEGKFRAQCCDPLKKRRRTLGLFKNPNDAFLCYKKIKEQYAKELADYYNGKINPKAIEALRNYEVDIND
jgi:hypothetical protein